MGHSLYEEPPEETEEDQSSNNNKSFIVVPYMKGLAEAWNICRRYGVEVYLRVVGPSRISWYTLRTSLKKSGVIYKYSWEG